VTEQSAPRDLIIVGSGPAGYTAAIYAARAGLAPLVIAGSVTAGGALMNTTEVENFPGFPDGIQGPELMENLQKQAEKFGAEVLWDDVVSAELRGTTKTVVTGGGETFTARAVVLATGSAYRELGLEDEKRLSGRGVSWCATCDGFFFRDQEIIVVGGGDSAVEEATFLTRFGKRVTMVHRRGELRASKIMADRAKNDPKIEFAWHSEVVAIHGADKVRPASTRRQASSSPSGTSRAPSCCTARSLSTRTATSSSRAVRRSPTSRASSRAATPSTTPTARRSRLPAPAARPRSTPSTT
jgi:thioredoxin reductase (NADPH)